MSKIISFNKHKKRVPKKQNIPKHFTIDVYLVEEDGDAAELSYSVDVSDNLLDSKVGRKLVADVFWSYLVETWEGDPARAIELIDLVEEWANGS